jgi:ATP-binding cassette subfamily C protein
MRQIKIYIWRSFSLLNAGEQKKYLIYLFAQSVLSILDVLGIAVVGILGLTAINGFSGTPTTGLTERILAFIGIAGISFYSRVIVLAILAVGILLTRTIITIYVSRRGLRFLSLASARISVHSFSRFLNSPFPDIQKVPTQEAIFLLTIGINRLILGVLGSAITLATDGALVALILCSLFVVNIQLAISTLVLFLLVGGILKRVNSSRTSILTSSIAHSEMGINSTIRSALENFREISVKNIKQSYVSNVEILATQASIKDAEVAFMPLSSKYIVESSLIVVTFVLGGIQFILSDAKTAIATLALFMTAGARVLPALLRIQQSFLSIQASVGTSNRTWSLIQSTKDNNQENSKVPSKPVFTYDGFSGIVEVANLEYNHPNNQNFKLEVCKLLIESGEMVAIVGSSGAGKSTLADIILGILLPDSGFISISGMTPREVINLYPGSIAYIPQKVFIADCSVKENIALGYDQSTVDDEEIFDLLRIVHLEEWVKKLGSGINAQVGESGHSMSGGQQQRLGIARALYTKPKLILMDEATSSLDGQTELDISDSIRKLKGDVTLIVIAHRLSTIKDADKVILLESGKVLAEGKFDEIRMQVPNFDEQAKIMGL